MVTKVFFFIALFGVASSTLPRIRMCDPVQDEPRKPPSHCSNYINIEHLDAQMERIESELTKRIHAVEKKTSKIDELKGLGTKLQELKSHIESEFHNTKKQLEKSQDDIAGLKREVQKLVKHREIVGGNLTEIEQRLDTTERQLREKKAKLENLETETETAFSDTQKLLNLYKSELSNLNTTAQELEVKVEARLDSSKAELEAKLKKIQTNSEAFSTKLKEQKDEVEKFKGEADKKFMNVNEQLQTQKTTLTKQKADTDTLRDDVAGITNRLTSAEKKADEQKTLEPEVDKLKAAVNTKVAFSATIIESKDVFTGPKTATTSSTLIFNKVFTNIGNAYNSKTGVFTAPVKGVYHFSFMTFGYNSHTSGGILVKNGHYQVSTWEFTGPDISDTTSNTVILELNVTDCINIILWEGGKIHTGVFSGFLVYPTL
ncbi:CAP-Gly domain-containing linker protein 1-like [Lates japonicus]